MTSSLHVPITLTGTLSTAGWPAGTGGAADVRAVLLTPSWTPDKNTQTTWGQISSNELSATGYNTLQQLSKTVPVKDATLNRYWYGAANLNFGNINSGSTVRYLGYLLYDSGTPANSSVLGRLDLRDFNGGNDVSTTGQAFEIIFTNGRVFYFDY